MITWSSASVVDLFSTKKDDFDAISAHRSAHRDREEPCYAARFNLTTGRCRRFFWKLTTISNRWPGFPATSVWGLAQGELRGQPCCPPRHSGRSCASSRHSLVRRCDIGDLSHPHGPYKITGPIHVAVGTALAGRPPRRSQRAELPHWAPTSGVDAQTLFGIRIPASGLPYPFRALCKFPGST